MAIGDIDDFRLYEAQFHGAFVEVAMQFADAFNAASRGSLIMRTEGHRGNFRQESFYAEIAATTLINHRDPTDSAATVTPDALTQGEITGAKVNKRTYVAQTEDSFYKQERTPAELGRVMGRMQGVAVQVDRVNRACASLRGAIGQGNLGGGFGVDSVIHNAGAPIVHKDLNEAIRLFGDAGASLQFIVMHSKVWYDLVGSAITSNDFETQAFAIANGSTATLGRPVLVTDSARLIDTATTPDTYYTLLLSAGAMFTDQSEPLRVLLNRVEGKENIEIHRQTEWADTITVKGYSRATGTVNPDDDELEAVTNWKAGASAVPKTVTDKKSSAGVILLTQ